MASMKHIVALAITYALQVNAQTYSIDAAYPFQPSTFLLTVSAYSQAIVKFDIDVALDTAQVAHVRSAWGDLVAPSLELSLLSHEAQDNTLSKSLAFFGFFGGNGKTATTSFETANRLQELNISQNTASEMIDVFYDEVDQMYDIAASCVVDNLAGTFSVTGTVILLRMEGEVQPQYDEPLQYSVLSAGGVFAPSLTSPATNTVACQYTRKPIPTAVPTQAPTPVATFAPTVVVTAAPTVAPIPAPTDASTTVPVLTSEEPQRCTGAVADPDCCSEEYPCGVNEGDCDYDADCEGNLICGDNNCNSDLGLDFPSEAWDCCVEAPEDSPIATWDD